MLLLALDWSTERLGRVRALLPFAVIAGAGAVLFAALCDAVGDHNGITAVDRPVSAWFAAHRSVTEGHLGLLLAKATSPAVLIALVALTAVLLRWRGLRLESTVLAAGTVLAYGVGAVAKLSEHRARPLAPVNLAPETEPSFPSGHVLVLTTVAFLVLALAWRHLSRAGRIAGTALAVAATAVISADRLVVGAHWLTDVVGAVALAAIIVAVAAGTFAWLRPVRLDDGLTPAPSVPEWICLELGAAPPPAAESSVTGREPVAETADPRATRPLTISHKRPGRHPQARTRKIT